MAELTKIEITDEFLQSLTADQRALFAILSLAISEIETLRGGLKLGPQVQFEPEILGQVHATRQFALMRMISCKLIEVFGTLGLPESKQQPKIRDATLQRFYDSEIRKKQNDFADLQGLPLARKLRDKVGFHYDFGMFKNAAKNFTASKNDKRAESFSHAHTLAFCPEMEFVGPVYGDMLVISMLPFDDYAGEYSNKGAKIGAEQLRLFCVEAGRLLQEIWEKFLQKFVLPHVALETVSMDIPELLLADKGGSPTPMFVRDEEIQ